MLVLGTLAAIASLVLIVFGFPAQIITNYRRKDCDGLDPKMFASVTVAYTLWSIYGWIKPDWFLIVSQTPGALMTGVIFVQIFYYHKKTGKR